MLNREVFTRKSQVIDVVEINHHLLPVINRFGIHLGNKDQSFEQICLAQNIDIDFFLAILNTYHDENYFPEQELKTFAPLMIIDYLQKTHQYYKEYVLPKIDRLLDGMIKSANTKTDQLALIVTFYEKYKREFLLHIQEEEDEVFPYIKSVLSHTQKADLYTIHSFEKEHGNVDDKLNDLINLIVKYVEPVYDPNLCNEFLVEIFQLEKDARDHARIEDKILIPLVVELESQQA